MTNNITDLNFSVIPFNAEQLKSIIKESIQELAQDGKGFTFKNQNDETMLSPKEAAARLQVTIQTLIKWDKSGKLKPLRIGRRCWYRMSSILEVAELGAKYNRKQKKGASPPPKSN